MKIRALCILFLLVVPAWARSHKQPAKQAHPADSDYVLALANADRFLHAWQTGDLENGMVLLSDGVRHSHNADKLEQFFTNGTGRAYEIGAGHGNHGRYSFPVVLHVPQGTRVAHRSSEIILVNTGKDDWVVDKLP